MQEAWMKHPEIRKKMYGIVVPFKTRSICQHYGLLKCYHMLIKGFAKDHTSNIYLLAIIGFFYPSYIIYTNLRSSKYNILSNISSICDDPNHLYLPRNVNWAFDLKTLSNEIYFEQVAYGSQKMLQHPIYKINLFKPSNNFLLYKDSHTRIIDNEHQYVGYVNREYCFKDEKFSKTLSICQSNWKVKKISDAYKYKLLLMTNGTVFIQSDFEKHDYTLFSPLPVKITDIDCRKNSSLLLDVNHHLWVYGSNIVGKLGIEWSCENEESEYAFYTTPIKHEFFSNKMVESIYCSHTHCAIILRNGNCYLFGYNFYAQIGNNPENVIMCHADGDEGMSGFPMDDWIYDYVIKPYLFQTKFPGVKVKQAVLGEQHTILLTDDNKLYGFGCNDNNEISQSSDRIIIKPTLVNTTEIGIVGRNEKIVKIMSDTRYHRTVIITTECF
eukprot:33299_1